MWKFHDFSITQILREINFGNCKSAKSAILTHLVILNFDFYEFFALFEGLKPNSEPQNVFKWQILHFYNPQNRFQVDASTVTQI